MKGDIGMNTGNLIRKNKIECPLCGKVHDVEERTRIAKIIIKGERVDYVEIIIFVPIAMMVKMNLQMEKWKMKIC